jgi:calcineurin-like phosphoesterase family protein
MATRNVQQRGTLSAGAPERRSPRTWFTADTHFGHGGAIGRFKRPFRSAHEMDDALVAAWNDTVSPDDEVWHLGDFAVRATRERVSMLLSMLNGRKHLITGNNDRAETVGAVQWASVAAYADVEVDGTRLILCHYPFRSWDGMYKGAYNLHGHSHGQLAPLPRQVDVGVDVWRFRPITLGMIRGRRRGRARDTKPRN